ncbi:hypothetical protein RCL1_005050 [Eukaryota sp. TZLM3-RCL]
MTVSDKTTAVSACVNDLQREVDVEFAQYLEIKRRYLKLPDLNGIKARIAKNAAAIAMAKDKDIIIFIGNTGSGKSTLVNFVAGKQVVVDKNSRMNLVGDGVVMEGGINSVTSAPQFLATPIGVVYDLPGFRDTNGTEANILHCALTKALLKAAKSVKVVLVASLSELEACRGELIPAISNYASLFGQDFFNSSMAFVLNQFYFPAPQLPSVITRSQCDNLSTLLQKGRLISLPYVSDNSTLESLKSNVSSNLIRVIQSLQGKRVENLDMSMVLDSDCSKKMTDWFLNELTINLKPAISNHWLKVASTVSPSVFAAKTNELFTTYINEVKFTNEAAIVGDLLEVQKHQSIVIFENTIFHDVFYVFQSFVYRFLEILERKKEVERLEASIAEARALIGSQKKDLDALNVTINNNQKALTAAEERHKKLATDFAQRKVEEEAKAKANAAALAAKENQLTELRNNVNVTAEQMKKMREDYQAECAREAERHKNALATLQQQAEAQQNEQQKQMHALAQRIEQEKKVTLELQKAVAAAAKKEEEARKLAEKKHAEMLAERERLKREADDARKKRPNPCTLL